MTTSNRLILMELMEKFNNMNCDIQGFHKLWKPFIESLSKEDAQSATQVMFETMLHNAKKFREETIRFVQP